MDKTDFEKNYLRKSMFIMIIFPLVLWGGLSLVLLIPDLGFILNIVTVYRYKLILSLFIFFCFYGLVQYLILRKLFSESAKKEIKYKEVCATLPNRQLQGRRTLNKNNTIENSRSFFYILSVLQDKGQFLDFISEDLSKYEDAQIGVAVRLIHKNCKKSLDNYFSLEHIIKGQEGETITLSDFDDRTIKFIGNTAEKPPYSGMLKHRGWKIRCKTEKLPNFVAKLAKLNTIYPAQIEAL